MNYRIFGGFLIVIALVIFGTVAYRNSKKSQQPLVYSATFMMNTLWESYKKNYVESETGRTVDNQRNNVTTSEGQSYTMLRAVWQDDKQTFDKTWQWTQSNLKRPTDNLFSWLYGQRDDGTFGVLTDQGGQNSATDADTDIALALILASARWEEDSYLEAAKKIIPDIWEHEIVTVAGTPFIVANNVEKRSETIVITNPSYLAPYAYKIFANIDTENPWHRVVDSSYELIEKSITEPLDKEVSGNLPPDWIVMHRTTGELQAAPNNTLTTNFGFDALRLPFRLALDYAWNKDERAKKALEKISTLESEWSANKAIFTTYSHQGLALSRAETPAMYGGVMGYFTVIHPSLAEEVYKEKLQSLYSADFQDWKQPLSYYDDNWAWFGIALHNNRLINYFNL